MGSDELDHEIANAAWTVDEPSEFNLYGALKLILLELREMNDRLEEFVLARATHEPAQEP